MAYTLISFIGTGVYEEGYHKTKYVFHDKKEFETHIFLKALLETKYKEFSKIILVGTKTSAWDMLVEENTDLWEKVLDARENKTISDDLISEIEKYLSQAVNIPVVIKYHTDVIDDNSSLEIFDLYNSIIPEITDENILFDITHAFRSMPILLYQALQFSVSQNKKIKNVELVYGEYIKKEDISYVRDLSNYWKYSQISDALTVFNEKLDGFHLAELIKKEWDAGSKAIKSFSEIVQTNFCLQVEEVFRQIKNAMEKYPENAPQWLDKIKSSLEKIYKDVKAEKQSRTLYNFSLLLYEHKLNIQAVICLQVAVEVCICEKFANESKIGDYGWWQDYGKSELKKIEENDIKELKKPLTNLEYFRNQVAHGGAKNRDGNFPNAANIPSIYESGRRGVENLFKKLGEM